MDQLIATDGSFRRKTNQTAWGIAYLSGNTTFIRSGYVDNFQLAGYSENGPVYTDIHQPGTNNRGELIAILSALYAIDPNAGRKVMIISDSEYCIKTITDYYLRWEVFGFGGKLNLDILHLIIQKYRSLTDFDIQFVKVKSHTKKSVWMNYSEPEMTYYMLNSVVDDQVATMTLV